MPTDRAPGSAPAPAQLSAGAALLDAEKLDCYRLAVAFQALTGRLLPKRSCVSGLRDQLDRASVSIVLNIAEGAGRFSPADKGRFYASRAAAPPNAPPLWTSCSVRGWLPLLSVGRLDRFWSALFRC